MKYFFLYFCLVFSIYSDKVYQEECNTSIDDNGKPAFITFYGDSLGDFVDFDFYGIFGWDNYLKFHKQEIDWRVQNMAVKTWRTVKIIGFLQDCVLPTKRANFITSNHAAFEIGGNDMVDWIPTLIFMPWKYFSYYDPITGQKVMGSNERITNNVRVITRILRHPQIDKDVLIMGNFPGLSYSPSLGQIGDYFQFFKKMQDDTYNKVKDEDTSDIKNVKLFFVKQYDYLSKIFSEFMRNLVLVYFLGPWGLVPAALGLEDFDMIPTDSAREGIMKNFKEAPDWYVNWVYNASKSPTTALSLGLGLMQPGLQEAAMAERDVTRNQAATYTEIVKDKNGVIDESKSTKTNHRTGGDYVHFLPLYHTLIRWTDCVGWGQCWVGEPFYFRDGAPGHVNMWGYLVWSKLLADKVTELGWQNPETHRNGGKVLGVTEITTPGIEEIPTAPPPPSPIDWALLFCILYGKCW